MDGLWSPGDMRPGSLQVFVDYHVAEDVVWVKFVHDGRTVHRGRVLKSCWGPRVYGRELRIAERKLEMSRQKKLKAHAPNKLRVEAKGTGTVVNPPSDPQLVDIELETPMGMDGGSDVEVTTEVTEPDAE